MTSNWDVVVAAGGTGGHILPALALADAIVEAGVPREAIAFFGGEKGGEREMATDAGLDFVGFDVVGLRRAASPSAAAANLSAAARLWRARRKARRILDASGVGIVCGMGGYASLPAVLAGHRGKAPFVYLYESNSVPGLATKLGARRCAYVGTAFQGCGARLPAARRVKRVGFMVRPELENFDRQALAASARNAFGLDGGDRRTLVAFGGSQGALRINEAVVGLLTRRKDDASIAVVHLTGRRDYDAAMERASEALGPPDADGRWVGSAGVAYVPVAFESRMHLVYAVADLALCRSGAATSAELAFTGTPAICVPYPYAANDHQRHNAAELEAIGAADMIADADLDGSELDRRVGELFADDVRRNAMAAAARSAAADNGRTTMAADVVEELRRMRSAG